MDHDHDNPYQAPKAEISDSLFGGKFDVARAGGVTEPELRAFVGRRADRYPRKWSDVLAGEATRARFNWAVFFLSGLYFPYRKMYRISFLFYAFLLLETIVEDTICFLGFGLNEPPPGLDPIIGIVIAIVCGMWANTWYLSHAKNVIAQTRAEGLAEDVYLDRLARRGGTSLTAAIAFIVLAIVTFIGWTFIFEFLGGPPVLE